MYGKEKNDKESPMKILVGYDGSEASNTALGLAKKHAAAFEGRIYVLTSMVGGPMEPVEDIEEAKGGLLHAVESIEKDGIPCEEHLLIRGNEPGEDLVQFAEDNDIDEIIIGVIKKSKVDKFLFGSNAQYVILHAKCPVITVK